MTKQQGPRVPRILDPDYELRPGREDVPGDGSVQLLRTEEGHVLLYPSAWGRSSQEQREIMAELQDIAAVMARCNDHLAEVIREGREEGISWDMLGWCIGRTGRAVSMRFGDRRGEDL